MTSHNLFTVTKTWRHAATLIHTNHFYSQHVRSERKVLRSNLPSNIGELTRERNSSRHQRYSSYSRRSHSRSRSVNRGSGICYYHRRYKEQARKCVSPCAFVQTN
ncbi:hypothetical protein TNCV_352551, partial [Trichonephila clavipes]